MRGPKVYNWCYLIRRKIRETWRGNEVRRQIDFLKIKRTKCYQARVG